jgi:hypothetical protein
VIGATTCTPNKQSIHPGDGRLLRPLPPASPVTLSPARSLSEIIVEPLQIAMPSATASALQQQSPAKSFPA